jgi:hypothetical protein
MKMRKITVIKADGTIDAQVVRRAELPFLQEMVGGNIEQIPHFAKYEGSKCRVWCNDEGRVIPLPKNDVASKLWKEQVSAVQSMPPCFDATVFGNIVIEQVADV